jgi:RHS repeat-associated protein
MVNGQTTQYQYDAFGNRIARTVGGVVTRYVVDPTGTLPSVLAETDGSGNITSYYVYGLGLISKITPGGQAYFYQYDGLGSTIAMTDLSGNVVNQYAYDPFGNLANSTEAVPNPFRYVGALGVMDEGNGLLYMRARYYAPNIGRFINQDPIGLAGGLNLYAYVGNNPANSIDPSGLSEWLHIAITDTLHFGADTWSWSPHVGIGNIGGKAIEHFRLTGIYRLGFASEITTLSAKVAGATAVGVTGVGSAMLIRDAWRAGWKMGRWIGENVCYRGSSIDEHLQRWFARHIWGL